MEHEVLEVLKEFRSEMSEFRGEVLGRFAHVESRFDRMDARFTSVDTRLSGVDTRLNRLDARVDITNMRLDNLEKQVEAGIETLGGRLKYVESGLQGVVKAVEQALSYAWKMLDDHERRIGNIEQKAS